MDNNKNFINLIKNVNITDNELDLYELNAIKSFLLSFKYQLISLVSNIDKYKLDNLEKTLKLSLNWLELVKYIDNNINLFSVAKLNIVVHQINRNGVNPLFFKQKLLTSKHKNKNIIFQFTNIKKKNVKIDFNLLDKFHGLIKKSAEINFIDVINSLDDISYVNKEIKFANQKFFHDKLFAIISLHNNIDHVCEYFTTWILKTKWAYYFKDIDNELKKYCSREKYNYHYSYRLSLKNCLDGLKIEDIKLMYLTHKIENAFNKLVVINRKKNQIKHISIKHKADHLVNYLLELIVILQNKLYLLIQKVGLNYILENNDIFNFNND